MEVAGNYENEPEEGEGHERKEQKVEPSVRLWATRLKAAKNAAKESWDATRRAWEEYLANPTKSMSLNVDERPKTARFPAYWASTQNKEPALYSRTPLPVAVKAFDDLNDNIARLAGLSQERLAKQLMAATPFDETMIYTRNQFLHGAKATTRVYFDAKFGSTKERKYYNQVPMPGPAGAPPVIGWQTAEGEPLPEGAEFHGQDERGFYHEQDIETVEGRSIVACPVHYKDVLHTPNARFRKEIWWMAFRALMTKNDVRKRFGDVADKLTCYTTIGELDEERKRSDDGEGLVEKFAEIWEIWDEQEREVYWYAEGYEDAFLEVKPDPYGLADFFPAPFFMLGSCSPDDLYPVPDFVQLEPLINQMHGIAARLQRQIRAARRRGLIDGSIPDLQNLLNETDEAEFISVANFKQLVGADGTLDAAVWLFPVKEIVASIKELAEVLQMYQDKFDEMSGTPDIVKGVSDPDETASAQQLKGKYHSNRFSAPQKDMQRLARDVIEMMCDLALAKYPEQEIAALVGAQFWAPEDQQLWPQVYALLTNDKQRLIRIDIETDSTITVNMNAEIEQRNYLAKTLFEGLAAVAQASQQNPAYTKPALKVLLYTIRGLQKGKEIENEIEKMLQELDKPQQPAPDPEMVKAQSKIQIEQVQAQADIATAQAVTQAEMQQEQQRLQMEAMLEQIRTQNELRMKEMDAQIKQMEMRFNMALQLEKHDNEMAMKREQQAFTQERTVADAERAFESEPPQGGPAAVQIGDTINVGGE